MAGKAERAGLWGKYTNQAGTFWRVLNISLRAMKTHMEPWKPTLNHEWTTLNHEKPCKPIIKPIKTDQELQKPTWKQEKLGYGWSWVITVGYGDYRRLQGGSDDFSWNTNRHCIIIYIYHQHHHYDHYHQLWSISSTPPSSPPPSSPPLSAAQCTQGFLRKLIIIQLNAA